MSLNLFSYADDSSEGEGSSTSFVENYQQEKINDIQEQTPSVESKVTEKKRIILPSFNLSESDTVCNTGSFMLGGNSSVYPPPTTACSSRKREVVSQEPPKRQEMKRWSMKPCQLTRKIYTTEDLGKD